MKKLEKNNKGFSLVELIVVVLIMAIIAVALAPQVMKWVNNSRIATDRQTVDAAVSYAQLALTDSKAYSEIVKTTGGGTTITIDTNGITLESSDTNFVNAFYTAAGVTAATKDKIKLKTEGAKVTITVSDKGLVSWTDDTNKLESDDLDDLDS